MTEFVLNLTPLQIFPLVSILLILSLGVIVLSKNSKSILNRLFFLISIVFTIWQFGTFMMFISSDDQMIIFWDRFIYLGVVFMPALQYHFSLVSTYFTAKRKIMLWIAYVLSAIFLFLSRSDYFVSGIFKYRWGVHTEARILHHFFLAFFFFYIFALLYNFYIQYKKNAGGVDRRKMIYLMISFAILNLVGGLGYLPAYKVSLYSPISLLAPSIFSILIVYAITRYRLMEIKTLIRRGAVFTVLVAVIAAFYTLLITYVGVEIQNRLAVSHTLSTILMAFVISALIALGFEPLKKFLQKTTDNFLFKGEYNSRELIGDLGKKFASTLELNSILGHFIQDITDAMKVEKMAIFLRAPENNHLFLSKQAGFNAKSIFAPKKNLFNLNLGGPFITYFSQKNDILVLEEEKRRCEDTNVPASDHCSIIIGQLEKLDVALALPLFYKGLVGLILLGNKKSGDAFTQKDIDTLQILASQSAVAIENSRLYEKVKKFNIELERRVNNATYALKEANEKLKVIDKNKSEFISVASHQLRTPLTVIQGYLSLIKEGRLGQCEAKVADALNKVYDSSKRMTQLVNDLLDVSRIEENRCQCEMEPLSLEDTVQAVIDELSINAQAKHVALKFNKKELFYKKVLADKVRLRQIVMNLIDNAIKYTEQGGVEVTIEQKKDNLVLSVKDTGRGMTKEDLKYLFHKFSRGHDAYNVHTEGTGLGLYVAKKLAELQGGAVWAESEGEDKGSIFYLSMPIVKNNANKIKKSKTTK